MQIERRDGTHRVHAVVNGLLVSSPLRGKDQAAAEVEAAAAVGVWRRRLKNLYLRNGRWYCVALLGGRRISKALDCDAAEWQIARRRARDLIRAYHAGRWSAIAQVRRSEPTILAPTIAQCYDIYSARAPLHRLRARTWKDYFSSLRLVLRGDEVTRVDAFSPSAIEDYAMSRLASCDSPAARRSICSTVHQARQVFSRWAMADYTRAGLTMPDMTAALTCYVCAAPTVQYVYPDATMVARTHSSARDLRVADPALWIAYILCYHVALRAAEAAACQWGWIEQDGDGRHWMRVDARPGWDGPKGVSGAAPIAAEVVAALAPLRGRGPHIIPLASATARANCVKRRLAAWMKSLGWTGPKYAHELRKLRGSEWYTHCGLDAASKWLRHSDPRVTSQYYADFSERPTDRSWDRSPLALAM